MANLGGAMHLVPLEPAQPARYRPKPMCVILFILMLMLNMNTCTYLLNMNMCTYSDSLTIVMIILMFYIFNFVIKIYQVIFNFVIKIYQVMPKFLTIQKPDYVDRILVVSFAASIKPGVFDGSNYKCWCEKVTLWLTMMN